MKAIFRGGLLLVLGVILAACPPSSRSADPNDPDAQKLARDESSVAITRIETDPVSGAEIVSGTTSMTRADHNSETTTVTSHSQLPNGETRVAVIAQTRPTALEPQSGKPLAGARLKQAELKQASPELGIFAQLVTMAGDQDLLGRKDKTLLAPTDQAFKALPAGQLAALRADKQALGRLIRNHVIDKRVPISVFADMQTGISTSDGEPLTVTKTPDQHILLQEARVMVPDQAAGKLLVHVIDRVLMPVARN